MNSIWNNLYDRFKDRRYGTLFFGALMTVIVSVLITFSFHINLAAHVPEILAAIGLVFIAFIWRGYRNARAWRRERLHYPSLSRDELRKARSKLVKDRNFKKL